MKTILITGGAGFIGSNFVKLMLKEHSCYRIINIDALTYAGNKDNIKDIEKNYNYEFIKADIRDRDKIEDIFIKNDITYVVNFAAESHVDRSIEEPEVFMTTNIIGTQVLLDTAMKHWKVNPEDKYCKSYKPGVKFLQISTDEVYGSLGETGAFVETMPLMPNYNGLRNFDTNSLNDNESGILKSREERMLISCQEREEISVQSSKLKLSWKQSEGKKKSTNWLRNIRFNLT